MITDKQNPAQDPAEGSRKTVDRELARESDANDLNDTAPYGNANTQSSNADFNRNRDGLYGGLPGARDKQAEGGAPSDPHPDNNPQDRRAPK